MQLLTCADPHDLGLGDPTETGHIRARRAGSSEECARHDETVYLAFENRPSFYMHFLRATNGHL